MGMFLINDATLTKKGDHVKLFGELSKEGGFPLKDGTKAEKITTSIYAKAEAFQNMKKSQNDKGFTVLPGLRGVKIKDCITRKSAAEGAKFPFYHLQKGILVSKSGKEFPYDDTKKKSEPSPAPAPGR